MKRRVALWAGMGLVVSACWILLSLLTPAARFNTIINDPVVTVLARITAPVSFVASRFPLSFGAVALINAITYGIVGLIVEMLRKSRTLPLSTLMTLIHTD